MSDVILADVRVTTFGSDGVRRDRDVCTSEIGSCILHQRAHG